MLAVPPGATIGYPLRVEALGGRRRQVQPAALVGRRIGLLLVLADLGELGALAVLADAARLVGQVDLEAIPAQLPHHRDDDDARAVGQRAYRDRRRAERAGHATDRARVVGRVEQLERPLHLQVGVRRHRAYVARLARRLGGLGRRGRRIGGGGGPPPRARRAALDPAHRAPRLGALRRLERLVLGQLARPLPAGAQALDPRRARALVTRRAQLQLVGPVLADPSLMLRTRRAQLAYLPPGAPGEERLRPLPAQQRPAADVARDV